MTTMRCLVIMPFEDAFNPVYQAVQATVASAVPGQPIDCYWLKDVYAAGRITDTSSTVFKKPPCAFLI